MNRDIHACITDTYYFGQEMGFDARAQEFNPIGWSAKGGVNTPPRLERFVLHVPSQQVVSRRNLGRRRESVPVDMLKLHPLRDGERVSYCYLPARCGPKAGSLLHGGHKADLTLARRCDCATAALRCSPPCAPRLRAPAQGGWAARPERRTVADGLSVGRVAYLVGRWPIWWAGTK